MHTGLVEKRESRPRNGRDEAAVVGDVDEVHRDQARRARHLAIGPDPPDVMGVGQRQHDHADLAAALDRHRHRLAGDAPAVAALAVEHQERAVVLGHLHRAVGHDQPVLQVPHVGGDELDAVAVVAGEVRVDEVSGDQVGLGGLAAAAPDDVGDELPEGIGGDEHGTLLVGDESRVGRSPDYSARPGESIAARLSAGDSLGRS